MNVINDCYISPCSDADGVNDHSNYIQAPGDGPSVGWVDVVVARSETGLSDPTYSAYSDNATVAD